MTSNWTGTWTETEDRQMTYIGLALTSLRRHFATTENWETRCEDRWSGSWTVDRASEKNFWAERTLIFAFSNMLCCCGFLFFFIFLWFLEFLVSYNFLYIYFRFLIKEFWRNNDVYMNLLRLIFKFNVRPQNEKKVYLLNACFYCIYCKVNRTSYNQNSTDSEFCVVCRSC